MSLGSWEPSASIKTRTSPLAWAMPTRRASPLPLPLSSSTVAPSSAAMARVPSLLWPSTTNSSSAYGAAHSSTGRMLRASLRQGTITEIRTSRPSGPRRLISVGRSGWVYQLGRLSVTYRPGKMGEFAAAVEPAIWRSARRTISFRSARPKPGTTLSAFIFHAKPRGGLSAGIDRQRGDTVKCRGVHPAGADDHAGQTGVPRSQQP